MVNITQMSKGILEGCVLQILNNRKLFSQEIVMQIQRLGFTHVSDGTLFPLLLRLEQEGYFAIDLVPVSNGPKRKYYTLNANGKEELSRFIEAWKSLENNVNITLKEGEDHV